MSIMTGIRNANFERSSSVSQRTRGGPRYGQHISGLTVDGKALRAGVFNENQVRAAAGLTMVIGAVAFSYAYFTHLYIPLQAVASFFFVEFLIRVTVGIQYSPTGIVAHAITRRNPPQWVSAKPKRFAWTLCSGPRARDDDHHQHRDPRLPAENDLPDMPHPDVDGDRARPLPGLRDPRPARATRLGDTRSRVRGMRERQLRCSSADIAGREARRRRGTNRRVAICGRNVPLRRLL